MLPVFRRMYLGLLLARLCLLSLTVPAFVESSNEPPSFCFHSECSGNDSFDRRCNAQNLCYDLVEKAFIFVRCSTKVDVSENSVHNENSRNICLADIAGVFDYSYGCLRLAEVGLENLRKRNLVFLSPERVFILAKRFLASNIMHVFHDDLLPLYATIEALKRSNADVKLDLGIFFVDDYNKGEFWHLYERLTVFMPETITSAAVPVSMPRILHSEDLRNQTAGLTGQDPDVICFSRSSVGLSKESLWYQYGFTRPQGPLPFRTVTKRLLGDFTDKFAQAKSVPDTAKQIIVVLSRKSNRRILNEAELALELAMKFRLRVLNLSLEVNSVDHIISQLRRAKIVIGMHGSLLILAMFLPPFSVVIELFPYAINPHHYTPYKTLASLSGMRLAYRAWRNLNASRSRANDAALQSISHLTPNEQQTIRESTEVKPHLCCSNAEWLYRINHDTEINVAEVMTLTESALAEVDVLLLEQRSAEETNWKQEL